MAGREDKYTTKALMGEGKLSMPSLPSFKDISPSQRKMEAREAQDARDAASEKTLKKYRKDLPDEQIQTDDEGTYKSFPRRPGTLDEFKKGGRISAKYMSFSKTGKPAGMKPVTKTARGGGIESKGKTKGRMV